MHLFILEFITGGGMRGKALPADLSTAGDMMLQSLLHDCQNAKIAQITTTRDKRLPKLSGDIEIIQTGETEDIYRLWQICMDNADAVWIIAPESDGILYRLTVMAERSNSYILGSSANVVKLTSSKFNTAHLLNQHQISCVHTFHACDDIPESQHGWVLKADDGAGGNCLYCKDRTALQKKILSPEFMEWVIQPFVPGTAASLSMICRQSRAELIACNRQLFFLQDGVGTVKGIVVNGLQEYWEQFKLLAEKIAIALPELWGYVGVDLVVSNKDLVVLEINPRLTTAYVSLHASLNQNPAEMILSAWQKSYIPKISPATVKPITVMHNNDS